MQMGALEAARIEARATFHNHVLYRSWNTSHGGVYVPLTDKTQPNPYLKTADRDIQSLSGKKLTLINPAFMTRQVNELALQTFDYIGNITSLTPLRPENRADAWETDALNQFNRGTTEASAIQMIEGREYMRLMRPLVTEAPCLNCHAEQGYREGDIRGGISVAVPMAPHYAIQSRNNHHATLMYGLVWCFGVAGTLFFLLILNRQIRQRLEAEARLRKRDKLDGVIEMARAVSHELNQPLQTILGNAEILMLESDKNHSGRRYIQQIKDQVERMGKLTRKLNSITNYETIDMPQGKVIDIEKSISGSPKDLS